MITVIGVFFCRSTRSVFFSVMNENCACLLLGQFQRIHEAQSLEWLVFARQLEIRVLDVQRGDVVRQQHDLVGEELLAVDARQVALGDAAQQVDDEVAGAGAGVEDV